MIILYKKFLLRVFIALLLPDKCTCFFLSNFSSHIFLAYIFLRFEKWLQKQDEFPLNYEELALTVEIPGKNIQKEDDEDIDGEEVPEDENQKDEEGDDDD